MILRPFQQEAYNCTLEKFENVDTALLVLATGLGKTIVAAHLINHFRKTGRILMLAHREELIYQADNHIQNICDVESDIEMGAEWATAFDVFKADVVLSTVQTQIAGREGGRMTRFDPHEFSLLIIDEGHHAPAVTYKRIIEYYKQNPNLKVLGLTATPDRTDKKAMGQIFEEVAYAYDIRDGIDDGWLVPIEQQSIFVEGLDYSSVKTTAGDLNGKDLANVLEFEEILHGIADPTVQLAGDKKTLIFAASVVHAERLTEIINRHKPDSARFVCGTTPKEIRRGMFKDYAEKAFQYLVNVGVACLDEKTEILTSQGWVDYRAINYSHKIANWKDGKIWFDNPLAIEIRDRRKDEQMVYLETKNRSIRVTDKHRMLYRTWKKGKFKVRRSEELVDKKADLPIAGIAQPFHIPSLPTGKLSKSKIKRRISANSYCLRKTAGLNYDESIKEAARRIEQRNELKHKLPAELTKKECEFIGFFLGDGAKQQLQKGGIEYKIWQAESYPKLCLWIKSLIKAIDVDSVMRILPPRRENGSRVYQWSFSRGTGFGPQKRKGLYHLEPYLNKSGSVLLWGLNTRQFTALCRGFWFADGEHGDADTKKDCNFRICNTNKCLLDLLQAIAACRGYRANITGGKSKHDKYPNHKPLWYLHLSNYQSHAMTKYRLQFEAGWKSEKVWCVKSDSGFIVTRRRGTVTVTGNTEGFDDPGIEIVVMARPTKSRTLYAQMAGRGTRPLPGIVDLYPGVVERREAIAASAKPHLEIMDFVGNAGRHKLVTSADILGGRYTDEVVELAKKNAEKDSDESKKPVDIVTELQKAEREIAKRHQQQEDAISRDHLLLRAKYSTAKVNPFNVIDIDPKREAPWHKGRMPTQGQTKYLEKCGVDIDGLTFTHASQIIDSLIKRREQGVCTYKMAKCLQKQGYNTTEMTFSKAGMLIGALAKAGWQKWKLPKHLQPQSKRH